MTKPYPNNMGSATRTKTIIWEIIVYKYYNYLALSNTNLQLKNSIPMIIILTSPQFILTYCQILRSRFFMSFFSLVVQFWPTSCASKLLEVSTFYFYNKTNLNFSLNPFLGDKCNMKPKIKIMGNKHNWHPNLSLGRQLLNVANDFLHGKNQWGYTKGDKNNFNAHSLGNNFWYNGLQ